MPLVIGQRDLQELVTTPEHVRAGIDACEACTISAHNEDSGQAVFGDLALGNSNFVKVLGSAAPGAGMSLQAFPAQKNPVHHPDSRVMLKFDGETGSLQAIFAGDELTGLRTSLPAALGARHLAPPGAAVLGILGSSYQARSHALTITAALPGIREILVWSPTEANRERFAREQSERLGIPVRACATAEEVVSSADVVTAAGNTRADEPAFQADWIKPGALAISMTRAIPKQLLETGQLVVPTMRRPKLVAFGFTGVSAPVPQDEPDPSTTIELPDVIDGSATVRKSPDEQVAWELANVYLWDLAIVSWAYDWAISNGVGQSFELTAPAAVAAENG